MFVSASAYAQIMTGVAEASLPTSSSICMIFFILACKPVSKNVKCQLNDMVNARLGTGSCQRASSGGVGGRQLPLTESITYARGL